MTQELAYCNLCTPRRRVALEDLFAHFRIVLDFVPDIAKWPDGEIVIFDSTLEPDDFAEDAA